MLAPGDEWKTGRRSMRARDIAVVLVVMLAGMTGVRAETYPSKPVTLIVPFPAGGPTDTIARIMGEHMSKTLGQSILVETVTGAGATIGVGRVVSAPPDGYTLSIGNWSSHVGSPAIYPVSWNPVNDLDAIRGPLVMAYPRCRQPPAASLVGTGAPRRPR